MDNRLYDRIVSREPIEKGWSGDRKYRAVTAEGECYLLRITPRERGANRGKMFALQEQVAALGVSMCLPLELGECEEGVYVIQSWINGTDAREALDDMPPSEQYGYGRDAGRMLRLIHSIPAPEDIADWESRFNAKLDRKIKMYRDCPIKFDGAEHIIEYVNGNRHLLAGRPQCYQHGDYHNGNMMLEEGRLVIIDFDRYDFGDPWEEFNRIVWCAQQTPAFAVGMVDGYFDNEPPLDFWRLLALYVGSNMLSSIPWAIPFGEDEIRTMLDQARDVLLWYENMTRVVPTWYESYKGE